jgi:CheY-like chemotaxis protein
MVAEKTTQKPLILLITRSSYYSIFFEHHLRDFHISIMEYLLDYDVIEKIKPDYIVIDDQEFKDSISEICRNLRTRKSLQFIPLLVISGNLKMNYSKQLIDAGANHIIQEPLQEKELLEELKVALTYKKSEEKLDRLSHGITDYSTTTDLRLRSLLNKNSLEPIYKTIREKKPISLLAVAVEYSEKHEFTEQQITQVIKKVFIDNSPIFPLGSGKYLIILDRTAKEAALFLAETLRDVIMNTLRISIAIGICSQKKPPYANIHDMLKNAKKALEAAQTKGTIIEVYS